MKRFYCLLIFLISTTSVYSAPKYIVVEDLKKRELKSNRLRIFGNKILSETKIGEVIGFKGQDVSRGDLDAMLRRLEKYYISNGYDLIEISYLFLMGEWYVFVDEGRLGKIIIKGENAFNTLLLKNSFIFKENIYNSTEMKYIIESVEKEYGFKRIQYRLMAIERNKKSMLNIAERFSNVLRLESSESYIEPRYDLIIIVKKKEWGDGLGGFLTYNSFGLVSGVSYSDSSTLISGDRFKGTVKGGINIRNNIDSGDRELVFTIASLDLIYYLSFFKFRYFKPSIESSTSDASYQRGDLKLNEYRLFTQDLSIYVGFELKKNLIFSYGLGEEYLYTHSFDYGREGERTLKKVSLLRSYLSLTLNYLISEPNLRTDFQENLKSKVRYYVPYEEQSHWLLSSDYTKTLLFGYDYMKFASGFKILSGDVPFFDEFSIAYSTFKSSFSDTYYARSAFYFGTEYDLSVYKDVFLLDVFTDFTVFEYNNYYSNKTDWLSAIDMGIGARLLFWDMFLLKMDYAFAYAFNEKQDRLLLFSISKVF